VAQTLQMIRSLLEAHGIRPRQRFGQNFLIDHNKLERIVDLAEIVAGDMVLEVGPGTGLLTERLLEAGARVVAIEVDRGLCAILRERLGDDDRVTLIEGDVMAGKRAINPAVTEALGVAPHLPGKAPDARFKLIANLPYGIASPLIATLAAEYPQMAGAIVMIQREVADRLAASPGSKAYGPLTVVVQAMCAVERVMTLPPGCFWPRPKVDSAVVRLMRRREPLTDDPHGLEQMTQTLFQKRRKQIGSILGRDRELPMGVEPAMRPEQLTVQQIVALSAKTEPDR